MEEYYRRTSSISGTRHETDRGHHGRPEASSYSSKCGETGDFDLRRILRGLASRLRNRDQQATMSSYVSLNTKQVSSATRSSSNGKRPSKRALLCAVTYNNKRKYRLRGTVNDVKDMRDLLMKKFGYPAHCIRVLTGMYVCTRASHTVFIILFLLIYFHLYDVYLVQQCNSPMIFFYNSAIPLDNIEQLRLD